MNITIILNGKKEEVEGGMNILKLLTIKNIRPDAVTVELNDQILEKAKYDKTILSEKDRIEFVYYMGGGYAV